MLKRLVSRCAEKMLWPMKLLSIWYTDLNFFCLARLSELIVECVIRFGRFVSIWKGSIGNGR